MMADPANDGEPETLTALPKTLDAAALGEWLMAYLRELRHPGIYPLTVVVAPNGNRKLIGAGGKIVELEAAATGV